MLPNYLTIGHIVQDLLPDGTYTPGGTVSFAALTAHKLGKQVGIVTAAPQNTRDLPIFEGISIAGAVTQTVTVFENVYTPKGRVQYLHSVAPVITTNDVPPEWAARAEIVHLGPVAQECPSELIDLFPNALIGVTPQGWMRGWGADKLVYPVEWANAAQILPKVRVLVLGDEDLPSGAAGEAILKGYVAICPIVVLTQAAKGCVVFYESKSYQVPAFPAKQVDPTGAGDVFATAFLINLKETNDPLKAARFANAAAACNIEKVGLSGTPTLAEVLSKVRNSILTHLHPVEGCDY